MGEANKKRLLEFTTSMRVGRWYYLYVKEGFPIRIMRQTSYDSSTIYPKDHNFDCECKIIISCLCEYENLKKLKKLYDALEDEYWKKYVKTCIDNIVYRYEKGITILKS